MALSNWDTFAFDEGCHPCEGIFTSPLGVVVEIYKNWLEIIPAPNAPRVVLTEGNLTVQDVKIRATEGPQQGCFFAVTCGLPDDREFRGMFGCGVYAFQGELAVGVDDGSLRFLRQWLTEIFRAEYGRAVIPWPQDPQRFNQGDAFFARQAGGGNMDVATAVGASEEPLLLQAVKKL